MIRHHQGILGINARNLLFIKPYNKDKDIFLADDKLRTKKFLEVRDIPVPKLLGIIRTKQELRQFSFEKLPSSFVIKPNTGYGGEGILIITEHEKELRFLSSHHAPLSKRDLYEHIEDILDGQYSIADYKDSAIIEERIITHKTLEPFCYKGLPDIRVIVFNLIPVMAMLRLPTKASKGKANLHLGAVGCGIDLGKGEITYICSKNNLIEHLPDGVQIRGFRIPFWNDILLLASRIQYVTNIGYLAVDIALDAKRGPIVLEMNARAGLNVQIANRAPLRTRLEKVQDLKVSSPEKGVHLGQELFGRRIQKDIASLAGKYIVGEEEIVEIPLKEKTLTVKAKISTRSPHSYIIPSLLQQIAKNKKEEERTTSIVSKIIVDGHKIQALLRAKEMGHNTYSIIIGKPELANCIIDPFKYDIGELETLINQKRTHIPIHIKDHPQGEILLSDKLFGHIERKLNFLYMFKPLNLLEEKKKFLLSQGVYNPHFIYRPLLYDLYEIKQKIDHSFIDSSVLGKWLLKKKEELLLKNELLRLRGDNAETITHLSQRLYHGNLDFLHQQALQLVQEIQKQERNEQFTAHEIKTRFEKYLHQNSIHGWIIQVSPSLSSRIAVGKRNVIKVRSDIHYTTYELEAALRHEIEVHIFRSENGKQQPYEIFQYGSANYIEVEEGLALYLQNNVSPSFPHTLYRAALHIISLQYAQKYSFAETASLLRSLYGLTLEESFHETLRQKRGIGNTSQPGVFFKDLVYLQGYLLLKRFVEKHGNIKQLYYGKIHIDDISDLMLFHHLKSPKYIPDFLQSS